MKRVSFFFFSFVCLFFQSLQSHSVSYLSFIEDVSLNAEDILYTPLLLELWEKMRSDLVGEQNIYFLRNVEDEDVLNRSVKVSSVFPQKTHTVGFFYPYRHDKPWETLKKRINKEISYLFFNADRVNNTDLMDSWAYMVLSKTVILPQKDAFSSKVMQFFSQEGSPLSVNSYFLNVNATNKTSISQYLSLVYYSNPDDFFLKIAFPNSSEELFLVKMPKIFSLKKSVESILSFGNLDRETTSLKVGDVLIFPEIFVQKRYVHKELENNPLKNTKKEGFFFTDVFSEYNIQISLNISSANHSKKNIITENIITENIHQKRFLQKIARSYVFDKPFFLLFKLKKEKNPYCILWVKNENFLKVNNK